MPTPSSPSIDFSSTSLPDVTGATTPSTTNTATTTAGPGYTIAAVLTESDTTVTAFKVPGTTGELIVDGTTLTWRHQGITLSNGDVISAGFNGLEDQTTTASLRAVMVSPTSTSSSSGATIQTTNPSSSAATGLTTLQGTHKTTGGGGTTASKTGATGASKASSGASSSSSGVAPTMSAGKTVALLGALGGMLAYGL